MIDPKTFENLIIVWIIFALLLFPVLLFVKQPYGRHMRKGWGPTISNQTGWVIMEIPSLIILSYYFIFFHNYNAIATVLFLMWFIHYINRTLVFPFKIKTKGKKMPLLIIIFGILFNLVNASFNGIAIGQMPDYKIFELNDSFRLILGFILFVFGMIINISSDRILISLRKSSTNGYQIPRKGLFKWISCPNYFGEILEWIGFAVMAWNLAALSFSIWTIVNLLPRALDHHKWYLQYFPDYPNERKAIIPYIL